MLKPSRTTSASGRPPVTSAGALERIALRLFERDGFEATTVDDIAAAAGIGRRTFFRYYGSKNDVVWGDFATGLDDLRAWLHDCPAEVPLLEALTQAVVRFNELDPAAVPAHRQRMALILRVPALQAHSTLQYASWREVVAEFVAERLGEPVAAVRPQLVAQAALAAALAAYEQWLLDESSDLSALLRTCFGLLGDGFGRL